MSARLIRRFLHARQATALIEFAFVAPVMILLAAGITELGRAYMLYDSVNKLAAQYAEAWADCTDSPVGACNTELGYYTTSYTIGNVTPLLDASQLTLDMAWVTMTGTTPTVLYSSPAGQTIANLSAAERAWVTANIPSGQAGVIVSASYNFAPKFFPSQMTSLMGSSLTANYVVEQIVKN